MHASRTLVALALLSTVSSLYFAGCVTYVDQAPESVPPPPPQIVDQPNEPPPPPPDDNQTAPVVEVADTSQFEAPLQSYGEWVIVGDYGRCWRPANVEQDWHPYAAGHWVATDDGWYWVSDEPWGWATYHYGRWADDPNYGWVWVPGTRWAPAWVEWRDGGGYVGWAPLPPGPRHGVDVSVQFHEVSHPERDYVFVPQNRFTAPIRPNTVIVNNTTIIRQTVNITQINVVNNTVIDRGPKVDVIEKATGQHVQPIPAAQVRHTQETKVVTAHPELRQSFARPPQPHGPNPHTQTAPTYQSAVPPRVTRPPNGPKEAQPTTAPKYIGRPEPTKKPLVLPPQLSTTPTPKPATNAPGYAEHPRVVAPENARPTPAPRANERVLAPTPAPHPTESPRHLEFQNSPAPRPTSPPRTTPIPHPTPQPTHRPQPTAHPEAKHAEPEKKPSPTPAP